MVHIKKTKLNSYVIFNFFMFVKTYFKERYVVLYNMSKIMY